MLETLSFFFRATWTFECDNQVLEAKKEQENSNRFIQYISSD